MLGMKKIREKRHISRALLASRLGVRTNTVFRYENGDRNPNLAMLRKIASLLNCSVDELIDDKEDRLCAT